MEEPNEVIRIGKNELSDLKDWAKRKNKQIIKIIELKGDVLEVAIKR